MIPLLPVIALLQTSYGLDPQTVANPCVRAADCRVVRDFELRGPRGERVPVRMGGQPRPWLFGGNIIVFPGESVTVRLEPENRGLAPRLVRTGPASARRAPGKGEMRVALRQAPDSALVFTVESRLAQPVEYNLLAVSADDRLYRPPVQTLQPGRTATERWTRVVAQVAMADFRPAIVGLRAPSAAGNAPLLADRRLHLPLGSSVTVRLAASADGELEPRITRTGRAEDQLRDAATAAMAAQAAKTQRETGDQERFTPLLGPAGVQREGPGADEVRFTFGRGPDGRSLLLIAENGHGRVLNYQAALRFADGRRAPTTVCRVDEGSLMIETWSGQVAELELEDFELLDPRPEPSAQGDCD